MRRWFQSEQERSWAQELAFLLETEMTTLYVSMAPGTSERWKPLLAAHVAPLLTELEQDGYHLHREPAKFRGYAQFAKEVDACDGLLFVGEEGWASAHRALMSLYIACGEHVQFGEGLVRKEPFAAGPPRPRPTFVLDLWEKEPSYAPFFDEHPQLVFLDPEPARAREQVASTLPAASSRRVQVPPP